MDYGETNIQSVVLMFSWSLHHEYHTCDICCFHPSWLITDFSGTYKPLHLSFCEFSHFKFWGIIRRSPSIHYINSAIPWLSILFFSLYSLIPLCRMQPYQIAWNFPQFGDCPELCTESPMSQEISLLSKVERLLTLSFCPKWNSFTCLSEATKPTHT